MNIEPSHFCSPFDAALAALGPPALFLIDTEGLLRFDAEWTRDATERARPADLLAEAQTRTPCWGLARDRASGYVLLVMSTSAALLSPLHPRLEFQLFSTRELATDAFVALGRPPIRKQPWS